MIWFKLNGNCTSIIEHNVLRDLLFSKNTDTSTEINKQVEGELWTVERRGDTEECSTGVPLHLFSTRLCLSNPASPTQQSAVIVCSLHLVTRSHCYSTEFWSGQSGACSITCSLLLMVLVCWKCCLIAWTTFLQF